MMTRAKMFLLILLRVLALGAMIAGIAAMVTSHDSATILTITVEAKYSYLPALKYFVIAEAVAAGYSALALLLSFSNYFSRFVLLMDVVTAMLLTSSISAALAIAELGKKGNSHGGWPPLCGHVPKFCDRGTGALDAGLAAVILYLLSLHSAPNPLSVPKP